MGSTSHGTDVGLLLLGIVLLHVGGFLIKFAWFPRRRGKTPHCGNCDYIVDPEKGDRCPECGRHLTPRTIVRGERVRRPRLGVVAVFLVLGGIVTAALAVSDRWRNFDWYAHKPAGWVISDVTPRDAGLRDRAWNELSGRMGRGELSDSSKAELDGAIAELTARDASALTEPMLKYLVDRFDKLTAAQQDATFARLLADAGSSSYLAASAALERVSALLDRGALQPAQVTKLTEAALAAQAAPRRANATDWMVNYLGRMAAEGKLSDADRDRFFDQAMPSKLFVRPDVIAGDSLPFWVRYDGRGPSEMGWFSRDRMISFAIDDEKPHPQGSSGSGNGLNRGATGSSIQVKTPGDHVLHVVLEVAAFRGDKFPERDTKPFWSRTVTLSAPFKSLPKGTTDYIYLRDEPEKADAVRRSIRVEQVRARDTGYDRFAMNVRVGRPPLDVAFEVFARHAGQEYPVGTVYCNAGEDAGSFGLSTNKFPPGAKVGKVDVILRSSEKVARGTVDLYEIWKGEIVFRDVPVKAE